MACGTVGVVLGEAVLGQSIQVFREPLSGLDAGAPFRDSTAEELKVQAAVPVRVPGEPLQPALEHGQRPSAVGVAEVIEADRDLDEPLEELAGGAADPRPDLLQGVVAFEEVAAVELGHALLEPAAVFLAEGGLAHDPGEVRGSSATAETARARWSARWTSRYRWSCMRNGSSPLAGR